MDRSVTNPPARSSADCLNAALVIEQAAAGVSALWSGTYCGNRMRFAADVWPGDALLLNAPSTNRSAKVVVRSVRVSYRASYPDLVEYAIAFANDWADDLAIKTSATVPAEIAQGYMSRIAATVPRGFVIAIDYGYTRAEQLAGRHRGTVMAFRRHSSSTNPYEAPGEQDITAHVNLTALSAAAEQNHMAVEPPLTQSQFLMGIGQTNQFADAFESCQRPEERAKVGLQLKHLVTPAGMGETFQVLVASQGVRAEALANLSGLSFGRGPR